MKRAKKLTDIPIMSDEDLQRFWEKNDPPETLE
jgi:hypothetical protein